MNTESNIFSVYKSPTPISEENMDKYYELFGYRIIRHDDSHLKIKRATLIPINQVYPDKKPINILEISRSKIWGDILFEIFNSDNNSTLRRGWALFSNTDRIYYWFPDMCCIIDTKKMKELFLMILKYNKKIIKQCIHRKTNCTKLINIGDAQEWGGFYKIDNDDSNGKSFCIALDFNVLVRNKVIISQFELN